MEISLKQAKLEDHTKMSLNENKRRSKKILRTFSNGKESVRSRGTPLKKSAKNEACASQFIDHDTSRNFELENIDL